MFIIHREVLTGHMVVQIKVFGNRNQKDWSVDGTCAAVLLTLSTRGWLCQWDEWLIGCCVSWEKHNNELGRNTRLFSANGRITALGMGSLSVHWCQTLWNTITSIRYITMKCCTGVHGPQRMNPCDLWEPLTHLIAPPWGPFVLDE